MEWKMKRHSRLKMKSGDSFARDAAKGTPRGKRRRCPFEMSTQKTKIDASHQISYSSFRSRIGLRQRGEDPFASSPLATERQYSPGLEFDTVCQRLALDSPPGGAPKSQSPQDVTEENLQDTVAEVDCSTVTPPITPLKHIPAGGLPRAGNAPRQDWVWTVRQENNNADTEPIVYGDLQPFAVLNKASMGPLHKPVMTLAAPSLRNDYYTNLLDFSCNGTVALALGSSVYLWNSETLAVEGHLHPRPTSAHTPPAQPGCRFRHQRQAISSLRWSGDGRALSIGTREGEIQLWDVDHGSKVTCLHSHHSVVGALAWKRGLLSSGSVLGRIHHYDPRAPTPLVGVAVQQGAVCSLEWSQGGDWLASGSTDGVLSIWDDDTSGMTRSCQPVTTMKQPSAVKAMGWCPWQRRLIATGGGRSDGQLRIWDVQSGTCMSSVHTNSQICSLTWSEKRRTLITGHGLPHHRITCWAWEPPSLSQSLQLAGHSRRVLHLALSPCGTRIVSAGADHCVRVWAM